MQEGILAGVRVLDFGRFIAAPYCGMILGELGAEVIRVDRPGGEEDRSLGLRGPTGESAMFLAIARSKKAITLDLQAGAAARQVLRDLVRKSDVVLHNFSPLAAEMMGLTYDQLREVHPAVIYTAISCYGSEGPYARRVGFDPIAQTVSGSAKLSGFEEGPPIRSQLPWVDYSTGLAAALGTLAALRHRDRTGEGQSVDCALLRTAVGFMAPIIAEAVSFGQDRPRVGNRGCYVGPSDLYQCRDGWVYISTSMDTMWRRLLQAVGHQELIDDPELGSDLERFTHRERVDPLIAAWVAERTVDEVLAAMEEARIPCGRCLDPREVPDDPQVRATGMLPELALERPGLESMPVGSLPFRLSRTPGEIRGKPPLVGEHNREIYGSLIGYTDTKLVELTEAGVI